MRRNSFDGLAVPHGARRPRVFARAAALGVVAVAFISWVTPSLGFTGHVFAKSFGTGSSIPADPFPLSGPNGVAVDQATHDVYVVDTAGNQVEKFGASGSYLVKFGSGGSGAGQFSGPTAVAVDNSGGLSGVVYVVDGGNRRVEVFNGSGEYQRELAGTCEAAGSCPGKVVPFGPLNGVGVDPSGNLWVYQENKQIDEFHSDGTFAGMIECACGTSSGFAVSATDVFANKAIHLIEEISQTGGAVGQVDQATNEATGEGTDTAVAIDPSTEDIYIDRGTAVAHYLASCNPGLGSCAPSDIFGASGGGALGSGVGIGVDGGTGDVYVADTTGSKVDLFTPVTFADVSTAAVSSVGAEGATLEGVVNPNGVQVTQCQFEYGLTTSYGRSAACEPSPGSGHGEIGVHVRVTGLAAGTTYHFRLKAGNANGASPAGADKAFTTAGPILEQETSSSVGMTSATARVSIDARGLPTTYRVEYGSSGAYGLSTPQVNVGAASGPTHVQEQLVGLQPNTEYHFRFVAANSLGTTLGSDRTFHTTTVAGPASSTLPDGRVYELVSPAGSANGNVNTPLAFPEKAGDTLPTTRPMQASVDGNTVVYLADALATGGTGSVGEGDGNEFLAAHQESGGWTVTNLEPPGAGLVNSNYQAFSPDLSVAILDFAPEEGAAALAGAPPRFQDLFSRARDGSFQPLSNVAPSHRAPEEYGASGVSHGGAGGIQLAYAGSSANYGHKLFEANDTLTANSTEPVEMGNDLYDVAGGQLHVVNILPNATASTAAATFGSAAPVPADSPNFSHVISNDGTRIFWTDLEAGPNMGRIFVREGNKVTVPVSLGPARYWTASADGGYAFYTENGELWRFDVAAGTREALAGEGAGVQGVVGASEDGQTVYLVATGSLVPGASAQKCEPETPAESRGEEPRAPDKGCNLYVWRSGTTAFIGSLAASDNELPGPTSPSASFGDWQPGFANRTAEVTPDGQHLAFMSSRSLTGYDNEIEGSTEREVEVFTYGVGTGLSCVSCNPSGARPQPVSGNTQRPEAFLPSSNSNTYLPRWISNDGSRVFFDTPQPLVSADTNGLQDVYEWERSGTGSCRVAVGCIHVISGGTSSDVSFLVDASASGNDVFFTGRGGLIPGIGGETVDLYDARVGGTQAPLVSTGCSQECRGVETVASSLGVPGSAIFSGLGNFPPAQLAAPRSAARTRAEQLVRALSRCRREHHARKRRACEFRARRRYAPVKAINRHKKAAQ